MGHTPRGDTTLHNTAAEMVKGFGAKSNAGRRYSVISAGAAAGQEQVRGVRGLQGKCVCIVFYPRKEKFSQGVKAFAAAEEKFNKENCAVIACTADSKWSTWSTSLGLTLKGEMAAEDLQRIQKENFPLDPTSYDIPTVSLVVLDERSCIRHIMSTSLEPQQAVESALSVAECINTCRLPGPELLRRTMREKQFSAKKCEPFKRRSFYDLGLHTEQGQITLLGESELSAQIHITCDRHVAGQGRAIV